MHANQFNPFPMFNVFIWAIAHPFHDTFLVPFIFRLMYYQYFLSEYIQIHVRLDIKIS